MVGMIDNKLQDIYLLLCMVYHTFLTILCPLLVKLPIQSSDLSEMTSYCANEKNEVFLLFTHFLITPILFILHALARK